MTLARLIETGSGTIAARLEIEGLSIQPVSDPAMAKTLSDGRRRVYCLNLEDAQIAIEEQVNIPEAELDGGAGSGGVTLFETEDEDLAQVFSWRPDVTRYVTGSGARTYLSTTDTTITALSTAGITAGDVIHIGTEAILVGTVASSTSLTGCTRGYWGTIAQKHWANVGGRISNIIATNRPVRARGRRARLYLYGDGDDLQGDGTRAWSGMVSREPGCDEAGGLWRIGFQPLTILFEGRCGGQLETPTEPRGVYYPWNAPLHVEFREQIAGTWHTYKGLFVGFWESQRDFIGALNTWLATAGNDKAEFGKYPGGGAKTAALPTSTLRAEEAGRRWELRIGKASGVTDMHLNVHSPCDGHTAHTSFLHTDGVAPETNPFASGSTAHYYPVWSDARADGGGPIPGARTTPRGSLGPQPAGPADVAEDKSSDFPEDRIYVTSAVDTDWGSVLVEWAELPSEPRVIQERNTAADQNWIRLLLTVARRGAYFFTAESPLTLNPILTLATGDLSDLRDALVTKGPEFANRATAPFVTSDDLADWSGVVAEAVRGKAWLSDRTWDIGKPVTLSDLLSAEFKLLGVYPIVDSDGKIALALLEQPNDSTTDAVALDEEIISVGWSSLKRGEQTVNRYTLRLDYQPLEDEWERTIDPEDAFSYSLDHTDRPMVVEPRSRANMGDDLVSPDAVAEQSMPYLGIFGSPYDLVTVNVSWKLFETLLGAWVRFSADHLPDFTTGQRPISEVFGIVVGRRWEIGQAHGQFTVLIPWGNVAGYAPTARITSQTNTSGNTWELGLNLSKYAPAGTTSDQFFQAGDEIRIVEYDSESPTTLTGSVDSVDLSGHVTTVTLDATWTPASTTWEMMFQDYASVQATQKRFCFVARSDGTLGGSDDAREFAA